ncbi:exported hypothetical protein [Nitrospina gracilis 3/211]|uniref:Uncharacterized protein n=1 Tax=Nitrospina gracilis (strain 3/211) TaxID=1266370 RepID=M1YWS0_NITG3|nr:MULTISPECIES: hypothetical protein [Nitrospina]MCF8722979.1 hypothetical protein [Nitrospina sp. Nb-3]CCQ89949.1 exported hypothetical protein [Nitrospina gracilis 3/211]
MKTQTKLSIPRDVRTFIIGVALLLTFAFGVLPWVADHLPWAEGVAASVKANGLNASGLFYTDVDY